MCLISSYVLSFPIRPYSGNWKTIGQILGKLVTENVTEHLEIKGGYMISRYLEIMHHPFDLQIFGHVFG